MNYTPNDLQNVVFKKSVIGGYSEDAVNEVMDNIVEDYNTMMKENIELKDKIAMLNEGIRHYKNIEESLQNTLIMAQSTSEEIKKSTHQKVENMLKEGQLKAQEIIDQAHKEVVDIKKEYDEIRKKLQIYKAKSENLLVSQLEMLKMVMSETE